MAGEKQGQSEALANERLDPRETYENKPKVTADDFAEGDTILVTVSHVKVVKAQGAKKPVLEFREIPGKEYWPNRSGIKALLEQLGDVPAQWTGKLVPLMLKDAEFGGEIYEARVWVAPPELWSSIFKEAGLDAPAVSGPKVGRAAAHVTTPAVKRARGVGKVKRKR